MQVYRNTNWTKRDYECTNVVAAVSNRKPDDFELSSFDELPKDIVKLASYEFDHGVNLELWGYV